LEGVNIIEQRLTAGIVYIIIFIRQKEILIVMYIRGRNRGHHWKRL